LNDLDELKTVIRDTPISSIIGKYIPLSKKGRYQMGLCPFHPDKDPSLTVNDTKGMFMCFSCQTGGDAILFVEKYKNIGFLDAIKDIANNLNISTDGLFKAQKKDPRKELGKKILSRAIKLYRLHVENGKCVEYEQFVTGRGISSENAKTFSLGFAPQANILTKYLESIPNENDKINAIAMALEIGVITSGNSGNYDTFYNRIIFPIWDGGGNPCGLGGRTVTNHPAKYVNSKESHLFKKRNILYAKHMAVPFIREKDHVILAEGYMDVRALFQYGFKNSVAVMGTATSEYAITSLKQLTKNFIMALDSDSAGMLAMNRLNRTALAEGVVPKIITLGNFKDPDEFLKNRGPVAFQEIIDTAPAFIDFKLDSVIPEVIPLLSDKKLKILEVVFDLLSPLGEDLRATERVLTASKRLKLQSDSQTILQMYKTFLEKNNSNSNTRPNRDYVARDEPMLVEPETPTESAQQVDVGLPPLLEQEVLVEISRVEKLLIRELVAHPDIITHSSIDELLAFVVHNDVKRYVLRLKELIYEIDESDYSSVMGAIVNNGNYPIGLKEAVGGALFRYQPVSLDDKVLNKLTSDLKNRLLLEQLKQKRDDLKKRQKMCDTEEDLAQLMRELLFVQQDIEKLKSM